MPPKEQLFRKKITDELFIKIMEAYNLPSEVEEGISFMKNDLVQNKTVDKLIELKSELEDYYLPCKARSYLSVINDKNMITILRQILKARGYQINSRERSIKGEKFLVYFINKRTNPLKTSKISGLSSEEKVNNESPLTIDEMGESVSVKSDKTLEKMEKTYERTEKKIVVKFD